MAERVGFEPTVPVKVRQFSRLLDSTTLAPLRMRIRYITCCSREISSYHASPLPKEVLHKPAAFVCEHAGYDLHSMI